LLLAEDAYRLSIKKKFLKGQSKALGCLASAFYRLNNYPKALQYYLEQLKIEEKRGYAENIARVNFNMALVYNSENDTAKAMHYAYVTDSIVRQNNLTALAAYTELDIGDMYEKMNKFDSALLYTLRAYNLSVKQQNDVLTGTALNNLGNIYLKQGQLKQALSAYRQSFPLVISSEDYNTLSEGELGLAKTWYGLGKKDSAYYYATKSYQLASSKGFLKNALNTSIFLTSFFKDARSIDSAFAYQQIMISLQDSIDSKKKIIELQNLTFEEQLRQKEIAELKLQEIEERHEKLQLLAIGIFIPICFFISIYLSRKKVHSKIIEVSGIISLLLFFEYITLLIHPYVATKTNHSPLLEIIIFVMIAALITPTHHRIEKWLISRLSHMHHVHAEARVKATKRKSAEEL